MYAQKLAAFLVIASFFCTAKVQKCKPRGKQYQANATDVGEECSESTDVVLTGSNFDLYVGAGTGAWLVMFYTDWCQYSKALMPEWQKASRKVSEVGLYTIGLGRFDCTQSEQKAFCHSQGVKSYPNIRLYNNGEFIEKYNGARAEQALVDYIKEKNNKFLSERNSSHALPPQFDQSENAPPIPSSPPPAAVGSQISNTESAAKAASPSSNIESSKTETRDGKRESRSLECTFSMNSSASCKVSKGLSLIAIGFGLSKLRVPLFAQRRLPISISRPFALDALASALVLVFAILNGVVWSAFCELAFYCLVGLYASLSGWRKFSSTDTLSLKVIAVVLEAGIVVVGLTIFPKSLSWVLPYIAAFVITANRALGAGSHGSGIQRREGKHLLPHVKKKSSVDSVSNPPVVLDFTAFVLAARIYTSWIEIHSDFGAAFYFIVLCVLHVFGDVLFSKLQLDGIRRNND